MTEAADNLGPIDYVLVEFPDGVPGIEGFSAMLDLAERGVICVLDLEFIAKETDGAVHTVPVSDLVASNPRLSAWDGASSGLLDGDDIAVIGEAIEPGGLAAAIIFENRWVLGVVDSWEREGGRLITDGGLAASDVIAALDATDPHEN